MKASALKTEGNISLKIENIQENKYKKQMKGSKQESMFVRELKEIGRMKYDLHTKKQFENQLKLTHKKMKLKSAKNYVVCWIGWKWYSEINQESTQAKVIMLLLLSVVLH